MCVCMLFSGEAEASKTVTDVFPVLQCHWRHSAVYRRGSQGVGHPTSRLDCSVWPARWDKGQCSWLVIGSFSMTHLIRQRSVFMITDWIIQYDPPNEISSWYNRTGWLGIKHQATQWDNGQCPWQNKLDRSVWPAQWDKGQCSWLVIGSFSITINRTNHDWIIPGDLPDEKTSQTGSVSITDLLRQKWVSWVG